MKLVDRRVQASSRLLALALVGCGGRSELGVAAGKQGGPGVVDNQGGQAAVPDTRCNGEPAAPVLLASDVSGVAAITAYGGSVYFAGWFAVNASVWSVPRDGGALQLLATKQDAPTAIVADSRGPYWTTNYALMHWRADGGLETTATGLDHPGDLVLGGSTLYVADQSNVPPPVMGKIIAFGPSRRVLADGLGLPTGVAVDQRYAYFTDWGQGLIERVALDGGAPATLASGIPYPSDIELQSGLLYFTSAEQRVLALNVAGGDASEIFSGALAIRDIELDTRDLYVAGHDPVDWASGALYRIPLDRGPIEVLDEGHFVFAVALDETRVYWARGDTDEVWMRCKSR